jgi:hypothetical protein
MKEKEIRAFFTNEFVRVYQAYNNIIADSALKHKQFVSPPFKIDRTTWIKPSFLWMMYRSGWATKENQNRILAIDITHQGFLWAVKHSCLSHFDSSIHISSKEWKKIKTTSPVIIQWDPERDLNLNKLTYRTIQLGLTYPAAKLYSEQWIIDISDITPLAQNIKSLCDNNRQSDAFSFLPIEKPYPEPN